MKGPKGWDRKNGKFLQTFTFKRAFIKAFYEK